MAGLQEASNYINAAHLVPRTCTRTVEVARRDVSLYGLAYLSVS